MSWIEFGSRFPAYQCYRAFGAHVKVVEVSQENRAVTVPKYAAVHDAGCIINPMLGEGQVQGASPKAWAKPIWKAWFSARTGSLMNHGLARYGVELTRLGVPRVLQLPGADQASRLEPRSVPKEASDVAWPKTLEFSVAHLKGVTVS